MTIHCEAGGRLYYNPQPPSHRYSSLLGLLFRHGTFRRKSQVWRENFNFDQSISSIILLRRVFEVECHAVATIGNLRRLRDTFFYKATFVAASPRVSDDRPETYARLALEHGYRIDASGIQPAFRKGSSSQVSSSN